MAKDPPAGVPMTLEPLVTRVLAPNVSPYTYTGTQTHIVGIDDVAIIDPGPADPAHHDALMAVIAGRPVVAIVITHHHRDHSRHHHTYHYHHRRRDHSRRHQTYHYHRHRLDHSRHNRHHHRHRHDRDHSRHHHI